MKILISCSGRQAFLVDAFREAVAPEGLIIASDSNPHVSSIAAADIGLKAPSRDVPEYCNWVMNICQIYGVQLLISLSVDDLKKLEPLRPRLDSIGCTLVAGP